MKISELPQPYRELAEKRHMEYPNEYNNKESVIFAFEFHETPERSNFWISVHEAKAPEELPPFPFKNGEEVEVSDFMDLYMKAVFIGIAPDNNYVVYTDGSETPTKWKYCRYPEPEHKPLWEMSKEECLASQEKVCRMDELEKRIETLEAYERNRTHS